MLNPHRIINKKLSDGTVIIRDAISSPTIRKGYERQIPTLAGVDRAHTRGAGLGKEYAEGIFYASKEVNRILQNQGIERFLRELFQEKKSEVILYLSTETRPVPGSLKLMEIIYSVDAVFNNKAFGLFELSIEVNNDEKNPRAKVTEPTQFRHYSEILKPIKRDAKNNIIN